MILVIGLLVLLSAILGVSNFIQELHIEKLQKQLEMLMNENIKLQKDLVYYRTETDKVGYVEMLEAMSLTERDDLMYGKWDE